MTMIDKNEAIRHYNERLETIAVQAEARGYPLARTSNDRLLGVGEMFPRGLS